MDSASPLIAAMATQCRHTIQQWHKPKPDLPRPLQPNHIAWMCDQIDKNTEHWPVTKLHRWIGFVQCAMMANRMLTLDDVKAMFDEAKDTKALARTY